MYKGSWTGNKRKFKKTRTIQEDTYKKKKNTQNLQWKSWDKWKKLTWIKEVIWLDQYPVLLQCQYQMLQRSVTIGTYTAAEAASLRPQAEDRWVQPSARQLLYNCSLTMQYETCICNGTVTDINNYFLQKLNVSPFDGASEQYLPVRNYTQFLFFRRSVFPVNLFSFVL